MKVGPGNETGMVFLGGWDVIHSEKKSHDMTMEKQPPFEDAFPISVCVCPIAML